MYLAYLKVVPGTIGPLDWITRVIHESTNSCTHRPTPGFSNIIWTTFAESMIHADIVSKLVSNDLIKIKHSVPCCY